MCELRLPCRIDLCSGGVSCRTPLPVSVLRIAPAQISCLSVHCCTCTALKRSKRARPPDTGNEGPRLLSSHTLSDHSTSPLPLPLKPWPLYTATPTPAATRLACLVVATPPSCPPFTPSLGGVELSEGSRHRLVSKPRLELCHQTTTRRISSAQSQSTFHQLLTFPFASSFSSSIPHFCFPFDPVCLAVVIALASALAPTMAAVSSDLSSAVASDTSAAASSVAPSSVAPSSVAPTSASSAAPSSAPSSAAPSSAAPSSAPSSAAPSSASASASASASQSASLSQSLSASVSASASASASSASASSASAASASQSYSTSYV